MPNYSPVPQHTLDSGHKIQFLDIWVRNVLNLQGGELTRKVLPLNNWISMSYFPVKGLMIFDL
jgi:hypothetical protein